MSCGPGTIRYAFNQTNPEAARWARQQSARLVVEISSATRQAIRAIIRQAFDHGLPPAQSAKLIRDVIGLTQRQALAVMNYQVKLMANGVPPARAALMAEKYAAKLHRMRALTIARTETMAASNEGQQQLWDQAMENGYLDPRMHKIWIATGGSKTGTCNICLSLDGEIVPLDEAFSIGGNPPAHPRCRCSMGLYDPKRRRR
jgi:SPP1 gp7 family putative phage head morphogenesis protein